MYHITAKIAIFSTDMPWERCLEFNVLKEYRSFGQYQEKQVSLATAKLAIFLQNMLWESCSKFNLEQLSHSMFCKNIASLAVAMETCVSWYWPNERYSYRTYYGKVVQNQILNNFPIACL